MTKKIVKYIVVIIVIVFFLLFLVGNRMYKMELTEKRDLTEEQIIKFEEDVKNGVEIDMSKYIVKEKNYDNEITKINGNISSIISFGFKKIFEYFLKNINI